MRNKKLILFAVGVILFCLCAYALLYWNSVTFFEALPSE
jgi:hypothetical protein